MKFALPHADTVLENKAFLIMLVVLALLFIGAPFFLEVAQKIIASRAPAASYPEVKELSAISPTFEELSTFFKNLAEKKDGRYAFEVLKRASLPPQIDMHLLGHVVGDELYKQEGAAGIRVCTQDFRNACSHSIVVGLLFSKGEGALEEISRACREAPGGSGAYTMCYHGLGHGVLAYVGYELPKAIALCKKIGTPHYNQREYIECVGGGIMEMISGGFHNRELWEEQRKKYFSAAQPLEPCASDFMPDEVKPMCYMYLTPHFWSAAGGDIGNPTPKIIKKSFSFCDALRQSDFANRDTCFGGFGKEFIGLALQRDIRLAALESVTDIQLRKMYDWCLLAPHKEGTAACVIYTMSSLYWGGENNRSIAARYCGLIPDDYYQRSCVMNLIGAVDSYVRNPSYREAFCRELPPVYQGECKKRLTTP